MRAKLGMEPSDHPPFMHTDAGYKSILRFQEIVKSGADIWDVNINLIGWNDTETPIYSHDDVICPLSY